MNFTLGLDTSSRYAHVAIIDHDGNVRAVASDSENHLSPRERAGSSGSVIRLIRDALSSIGIPLSDLSSVAVALGPGSYTGLRTGLGTAFGLRFSSSVPVVGVSLFVARLLPWLEPERDFIGVLSANERERYLGFYRVEQVQTGDTSFLERMKSWRMIELASPAVVEATEVSETVSELFRNLEGENSNRVLQAKTLSIDEANLNENPAVLVARASFVHSQSSTATRDTFEAEVARGLAPVYGKAVTAKTLAERAGT